MPKPPVVGNFVQIAADGRGGVYATAWNAATFDTLLALQVPVDGGAWTTWASAFAERGSVRPLTGGGLLFQAYPTQQSNTLYRIAQPGRMQKLATIPRPIDGFDVSRDLKRAVVFVRDYHGDAWMHRVVRP
jgi:hypothetical protein